MYSGRGAFRSRPIFRRKLFWPILANESTRTFKKRAKIEKRHASAESTGKLTQFFNSVGFGEKRPIHLDHLVCEGPQIDLASAVPVAASLKLVIVLSGEFLFRAAKQLGQLAQEAVLSVNGKRIPVIRVEDSREGDERLRVFVLQCQGELFQLLAAVTSCSRFSAAALPF